MRRRDYSSLGCILLGGTQFPLDTYHALRQSFGSRIEVYNSYGPTETTVSAFRHRLQFADADDLEDGYVSVGHALPGIEAKLVDDSLETIERAGERGELLLGGEQLMSGYINDPEATGRALVEIEGRRFFRTGDVAFRNPAGNLFVAGRNDNTLKRRGFRINLDDIDGHVRRHPAIAECCTISVHDDATETRLICFIVFNDPSSPIPPPVLAQELRAELLEHELPDELIARDSLPTSSAGKISRTDLLELVTRTVRS